MKKWAKLFTEALLLMMMTASPMEIDNETFVTTDKYSEEVCSIDNFTIGISSIEDYIDDFSAIDVVIDMPKIEEIKAEDLATIDEINLIALITMAEAEGECDEGKRLVIDTILNRVDSEYFPNEISDVIFQQNQFTSIGNGRIDKCYVQEDIYKLVEEELVKRTNYDVMFFTAGGYGQYGEPLFSVGNHYFCSYQKEGNIQ